jgi:hypothetical protein
MDRVKIEREKLDKLIRSAVAVGSEGLEPPDHVWHRILRRIDERDNSPLFQKAVRAERPTVPVQGVP